MGLIKELQSLSDVKGIHVTDEFYQHINKWKEMHRGYHKDMHRVKYHNIDGGIQYRDMGTLNMPKVVSNELATLIFNERCEISVSDKTIQQGTQDGFSEFIQDVFKDNSFNSNFQQYLEYMFALGGLVIKPYIKDNKVKLSYVNADSFIPVAWDNNSITEGAFLNEIHKDGKLYTHIEWQVKENGNYVIKNELYMSESGKTLGVKVPLSQLFPEIEPIVYVNPAIQKPLFAYFKPNIANNVDYTLPLGISVYANAYDTLKTLDIMFDSLQREFRLGRKRILVSEKAVNTVIDPVTKKAKRFFDPTDETYEALGVGNLDDTPIKEINTVLRVSEHIEAINAMLNIMAVQLGFSPGAFTFNGQGIKTATEVISEQSKTFKTKQSHENIIEQGIADLIESIAVLADGYNLITKPSDYDVTVYFDDSIAQDRKADIEEQILLIGSRLQSRTRAVMKLFGLTEAEAKIRIDEINSEDLATLPTRQELQSSILLGGLEE